MLSRQEDSLVSSRVAYAGQLGPGSLLRYWRGRRDRLEWFVLAALTIYWLAWIHRAMYPAFNNDDLMNLYVAWIKPWGALLLDLVRFWQAQERPLGGLLYRLIYELFGFNSVPFRVVHIGLLTAGFVLEYFLARLLSGSRVVAMCTILLAAFHSFLWPLYAFTGTIYDVLCGGLFFLALWLYVSMPDDGRSLWSHLGIVLLAVLAIDAKEMGVTLGASMLLWEVMVARRRAWGTLLAVNLVGVVYTAGRLLLPGPLSNIDAYRPAFTLSRICESSSAYTNILFGPAPPLALWAAILLVSAFVSRRALWGVLFYWLNLLPLLVVPPRNSGYVLYIPLFGLAFALASILEELRRRLRWAGTAMMLCAILVLHVRDYRLMREEGVPMEAEIREAAQQIPSMLQVPAERGKILMLNTPLGAGSKWDAQYVLALKYGRKDLVVEARRWDPITTPLKVKREEFQAVFDFDSFGHKYLNITQEAYSGIERLVLPRASMASSAAHLCIVKDISENLDGNHRWAGQQPEFQFSAGPAGATRFFIDIQMPKVIVAEAGPQKIQMFVNDQPGEGKVVREFGDLRLDFDLPRELKPGEVARIRLEVANPLIAPDNSRLSFLVRAAGLARVDDDMEELPSRIKMGAPEAKRCIVADIDDFTNGEVRWARQRPELRLRAGRGGATKFFLDLQMPEVIVKEAGAQRIRCFINGDPSGEVAVAQPGDLRLEFTLPRALKQGMSARVRLEVANPWISKTDGARLSFLLREAGLE